MKLAMVIFRYYPFGGLQRDFMQLVQCAVRAGHDVQIFAIEWQVDFPAGVPVNLLPVKGHSNHTRAKHFAKRCQIIFSQRQFDRIIGFNRMPGLDWYFAGDNCFVGHAKRKHPWAFKVLSRYKVYAELEQAMFASDRKTKIFVLNQTSQQSYQAVYSIPDERFIMLPPGIDSRRLLLEKASVIRSRMRESYQLSAQDLCLLSVGSNLKLKGVDRALLAIASLPEPLKSRIQYFVIGQGKPPIQLAKRLGLTKQVHFLGPRQDVAEFYHAADLLLHLAYHEVAGMVLLEALHCKLPVLTTADCGYAAYIEQAEAGLVVGSPVLQSAINQALVDLLPAKRLQDCRFNAETYLARNHFSRLHEEMLHHIESVH